MKKKNGFIATSLIYSFFLIFITLFFSVIADYLQQKVLLNSIEKGIKDKINSSMTIKDFDVGSMISFSSKFSDTLTVSKGNFSELVNTEDIWIIAKVDYENKKLILYSYGLYSDNTFDTILKYSDLDFDIDSDYKNETYIYKILYNFSTKDNVTSYNLGPDETTNYYIAKKDDSSCSTVNIDYYNLHNNCIQSDAEDYHYRKRYELIINNNILEINSNTIDGSIVITGVQS